MNSDSDFSDSPDMRDAPVRGQQNPLQSSIRVSTNHQKSLQMLCTALLSKGQAQQFWRYLSKNITFRENTLNMEVS